MKHAKLSALAAVLCALLTGCATTGPDYRQRVQAERAQLPKVSRAAWTGSMYPLLYGGELIRCRWLPFDQVKPGMLVRFWPAWSSTPIIHRAKRWEGPGRLVTQGDNCTNEDRRVTEEIYLGVWEPVPGTSRPRPADVSRPFQGLKVSPPAMLNTASAPHQFPAVVGRN